MTLIFELDVAVRMRARRRPTTHSVEDFKIHSLNIPDLTFDFMLLITLPEEGVH